MHGRGACVVGVGVWVCKAGGTCMVGGAWGHAWQRGACVAGVCVWQRGHVWHGGMHEWWGVCMAGGMHCGEGGMHGRGGVHGGACVAGGACMAGGIHGEGVCVAGVLCGRGHAWQGGMHGRGCAWQGGHAPLPQQILRDTVNERVVRILLECILVV